MRRPPPIRYSPLTSPLGFTVVHSSRIGSAEIPRRLLASPEIVRMPPDEPGRAVRAGHSQFAGGHGGESGELHCKLCQQCRSNPVSGRNLPKTGVFQMSAGDYRLFCSGNAPNRSLETGRKCVKARHWRAFLRVSGTVSLTAALPGWGGRMRTLTRRPKKRLQTRHNSQQHVVCVAATWSTPQEQPECRQILEQPNRNGRNATSRHGWWIF
jgi:hypothetical protein